MNEKKKILIHRIIWLSILLIFIFLPIIVINCEPELKMINSECYTDYGNTVTQCEIELKFNREIISGEATVSFYDVNGDLIEIKDVYFFDNGKVVSEIIYIDDMVDSYDIISLDFETDTNNIVFMLYFIPLVAMIFVITLTLNYKEYDFNGKTIAVYAGVNKHYLKIDDEKFDEHNSWLIFSPLKLSTKLGENEIVATISLTNNISLKINNKLYQPKKTD